MKLLIFLSALLTGLTGALAGEQRIAASAHSVSQLLATAEEAAASQVSASRSDHPRPSIWMASFAMPQPAGQMPVLRPRDRIPADIQV